MTEKTDIQPMTITLSSTLTSQQHYYSKGLAVQGFTQEFMSLCRL